MNYEQKYNEVLQKAKEEYNRLGELGNESMKRRFEIIFPELAESEDEKIRKWLIRTLKALNTSGVSIDGAYEMLLPSIDWLEKQKEQKPAEWNEDDELMRKRCIVDLGYLTEYEPQYKERYDAQINWLEFLRPQPKQE